MLSKEEKKIIDRINKSYDDNTQYVEASAYDWKCIVDLIEKQQKEIEEEKEKNKFINEVKAIGTDDVVNVVLTKSQYEYLFERATNGFNKEKEKIKNMKIK